MPIYLPRPTAGWPKLRRGPSSLRARAGRSASRGPGRGCTNGLADGLLSRFPIRLPYRNLPWTAPSLGELRSPLHNEGVMYPPSAHCGRSGNLGQPAHGTTFGTLPSRRRASSPRPGSFAMQIPAPAGPVRPLKGAPQEQRRPKAVPPPRRDGKTPFPVPSLAATFPAAL